MRTAQRVVVGFATLVLVSCTTVTPVSVRSGDQCYRCRRTIIDERAAAEIVGAGGFVEKFRGPGCLAKYMAAHPEEKGVVFVTDYVTGKMMSPTEAFYVQYVVEANSNEQGYRAFRVKADADAFAKAERTATMDWNTVLAKSRSTDNSTN